jgi:hypothetical protein
MHTFYIGIGLREVGPTSWVGPAARLRTLLSRVARTYAEPHGKRAVTATAIRRLTSLGVSCSVAPRAWGSVDNVSCGATSLLHCEDSAGD